MVPILSARYAAGIGLAAEHNIIMEAIHELWSGDVAMGESGASRMGRVGDVQPTVVPAAAVIKVALRAVTYSLHLRLAIVGVVVHSRN